MQTKRNRLKPAAPKYMLTFISGALWIMVGSMLLRFSYIWLRASRSGHELVVAASGTALALVIHHFGFLKVVDKNLGRISRMQGRQCIFSFMSWKSYILVAVMATMGVLLRHSAIPKPYLALVYIGIGLSLVLSSLRYLRVFWCQLRKNAA